MGVTSLKFYPRPEWCPFGLVEWSGPSEGDWWPRVFTWGFLPPPSPPPTPTRPSPPPVHPPPCNSGPKLMHTCEKNRLKRPKIKQGTTSKVNYILFNRLLSPVLLNKSGPERAKAVNFNSNFLNKCFSNYYQVRTWLVFADPVTYKFLYAYVSYVFS